MMFSFYIPFLPISNITKQELKFNITIQVTELEDMAPSCNVSRAKYEGNTGRKIEVHFQLRVSFYIQPEEKLMNLPLFDGTIHAIVIGKTLQPCILTDSQNTGLTRV
jgi:hypothetical protein